MPITHAFTSAKSDGGDATLVRPSDWNADHDSTHEADTVDAHDASAISIADVEFGVENVEAALSYLLVMQIERAGGAFPAQPGYGDNKWFYRNDLNLFYYYNGSTWELVGGGA